MLLLDEEEEEVLRVVIEDVEFGCKKEDDAVLI